MLSSLFATETIVFLSKSIIGDRFSLFEVSVNLSSKDLLPCSSFVSLIAEQMIFGLE